MNERTIDSQIEAYIRKELINSLTSLLEERSKSIIKKQIIEIRKSDVESSRINYLLPVNKPKLLLPPPKEYEFQSIAKQIIEIRRSDVESSRTNYLLPVNKPKLFFEFPQREDAFQSIVSIDDVDDINFLDWVDIDSETFSKMLLRLIKKSGEKNSTIYNRANIDRRHFSKIANNPNYQPSKQTVLAFAIALKLNFQATKDLLATAGFILTKSSIADLIVSFFIEHKEFDVDKVNQILYKYDQPLLGG